MGISATLPLLLSYDNRSGKFVRTFPCGLFVSFSGSARGVTACDFVAALGDENRGVARRRRHTLVRVSPLRCMARGLRVPLDCCCEHVGLYPGRRPSERHPARDGRAGRVSRVVRELIAMEVLYERVAGLDVGQGVGHGLCPHPGRAAWPARGDADVQDDDGVAAGDAGLAGRGRGDDRGDGVDLDVLEAAVLLPGGGDGGLAAQRRAHEGGAGSQDRRAGRGVDRAAARARVVDAVVRAAAADPAAADADPVPGAAAWATGPGRRCGWS